MITKWSLIKAVSAHIAADYGFQSAHMAARKTSDPLVRLQHVGLVALAAAIATATSDRPSALYVVITAITHYLIDSVRMPKTLDQTLHILALLFALFIAEGAKKNEH